MAKKIRIDINAAGIQAVLKSDEVRSFLKAKADLIAASAGAGMEASSMVGKTRARASVITTTRAARLAEANDRALTRAIDAGRG